MQFFPSLDIKDGKCVRLYRGKLDELKVYEPAPLDAVYKYGLNQANWLHIVDLDGAATGIPQNISVIERIIKNTNCRVQVGGGIRNLSAVREYLLLGASRVILGTSVLTDVELVLKASKKYFGRIALSLDTIEGCIATQAWTKLSAVTCAQVLTDLAHLKLSALIWTDIARDGTLSGVNVAELARIVSVSKLPIIVSGGIGSLEDLESLRIRFGDSIAGVISGKAIYERVFSVNDAQRVLGAC
ncbi:MAG: HisA/HisF-related TIM barrel protein [Candidatus Hodgkinia cicadicola]